MLLKVGWWKYSIVIVVTNGLVKVLLKCGWWKYSIVIVVTNGLVKVLLKCWLVEILHSYCCY